jgi:hypothetical protein
MRGALRAQRPIRPAADAAVKTTLRQPTRSNGNGHRRRTVRVARRAPASAPLDK